MDRRFSSSVRVSALQAVSPESKPQSHLKEKERRERWATNLTNIAPKIIQMVKGKANQTPRRVPHFPLSLLLLIHLGTSSFGPR
jgi:hypothetical protein